MTFRGLEVWGIRGRGLELFLGGGLLGGCYSFCKMRGAVAFFKGQRDLSTANGANGIKFDVSLKQKVSDLLFQYTEEEM